MTVLQGLARWRTWLYWTFTLTSLLVGAGFFLFAVWFPTDGIEPVLPAGLSSALAFVLSDLPASVLDFAEKYPSLTLVVVGLIWLIRTASRIVKEDAQEYAFQAWRPAGAPAPPAVWLRILAGIPMAFTKPSNLVVLVSVVIVLLVLNWPPSAQATGILSSEVNCTGSRGDCRLAPGETVRVTLRADQPRNETGVLLEAGQTYTAHFIANIGWRDKNLEPKPEGFEFPDNALGFPKFTWMRWRRPLPEGLWFQVIGRIDDEADVFPMLHPDNVELEHSFTAPKDGELVLLVNDVPFDNNSGIMTIEISRPQ